MREERSSVGEEGTRKPETRSESKRGAERRRDKGVKRGGRRGERGGEERMKGEETRSGDAKR